MSKLTAGWPEKLPPKIVRRKTAEQNRNNAPVANENDRRETNGLDRGKHAQETKCAQNAVKCVTDNNGTTNTARKQPKGYVLDVFNALLSQEAEAAYVDAMSAQDDAAGADQADNAASAAHVEVEKNCSADPVNHPSHYTQGGIECIDAIQAAVTGLSGMEAVCTGNVIKYVWRHAHKNGTEDLRKARFYLNKLILLSERKDKKESCGMSEQKERKGCS